MTSLCERCQHLRPILSGKGTRFLLCTMAQVDHRFPKYPPQPDRSCKGFVESPDPPDPTKPRSG